MTIQIHTKTALLLSTHAQVPLSTGDNHTTIDLISATIIYLLSTIDAIIISAGSSIRGVLVFEDILKPRAFINHVVIKMATEEQPHFKLPLISDNPVGWGPYSPPDKFKDTPYQPFSKGDKLGKVSQTSYRWRVSLSALSYQYTMF